MLMTVRTIVPINQSINILILDSAQSISINDLFIILKLTNNMQFDQLDGRKMNGNSKNFSTCCWDNNNYKSFQDPLLKHTKGGI